jgi:hypothetical protein
MTAITLIRRDPTKNRSVPSLTPEAA